jgi:hypothetical protein
VRRDPGLDDEPASRVAPTALAKIARSGSRARISRAVLRHGKVAMPAARWGYRRGRTASRRRRLSADQSVLWS